jgi:aryl-alcohol dehydrogenase-like predicted oxidoreductase
MVKPLMKRSRTGEHEGDGDRDQDGRGLERLPEEDVAADELQDASGQRPQRDHLGFSEWTAEQVQAAIDLAGPDLFVSSQPQYSMLWRAPEAELFGLCAANGISQIVWSPLARAC